MKTDIDFSIPSYIDNFLPQEEFENLKSLVLNDQLNEAVAFYPRRFVAYPTEKDTHLPHWNWYATHMLYDVDIPRSSHCELFYSNFIPKFYDMKIMHSLIRMKLNFYPWTETIKEHGYHVDYAMDHRGALFSFNTCDGYTEFEDGTKVDSVENRLMFFNPAKKHRSTTTTNAFGRFNLNMNFL